MKKKEIGFGCFWRSLLFFPRFPPGAQIRSSNSDHLLRTARWQIWGLRAGGGRAGPAGADEKGGLLGKKIEFVDADAPDAKAAVTETERLCTVEKVPVILGSLPAEFLSPPALNPNSTKSLLGIGGLGQEDHRKRIEVSVPHLPARLWRRGATTDLRRRGSRPPDRKRQEFDPDRQCVRGLRVRAAWAEGINDQAKKMGIKLVATNPTTTRPPIYPLVMRLKAVQPDVIIESSYENDGILLFPRSGNWG